MNAVVKELPSELQKEVAEVTSDLTWFDRCVCANLELDRFFVKAGHVIDDEALQVSRRCPSRRQEVIWAYGRDIRVGYYGGLSGGQRAGMTLEQALELIEKDTAEAFEASVTPV